MAKENKSDYQKDEKEPNSGPENDIEQKDQNFFDFGNNDSDNDNQPENNEKYNEGLFISKSKMALVKKLLENIKENNEKIISLLAGHIDEEDELRIGISQIDFETEAHGAGNEIDGKVIEGVFDGENMIGPDGKQYSIPVNYASKSKLVEGDILKLTITGRGNFVFKQIGPIERSRVVGKLEKTNEGNFMVVANGKKWRVLTASITYFKGSVGDEVVILVPKAGESKWAAVENVIRSKE